MFRVPQPRAVLSVVAALVTGLVVIRLGVGPGPAGGRLHPLGTVLVAAALLNSYFLYRYWARRRPKKKATRAERVSVEFRHEVERFLTNDARGARQKPAPDTRPRQAPPPPPDGTRPLSAPEDLIARIAENLEILGGYREDLSALLRLYRVATDEALLQEERKKAEGEVHRFAKVIALPFLLEDSVSVQDETRQLLADLRRSLSAEEGTVPAREEWTPVDLGEQIEQVIRSLPEERARAAYIDRHLGDMPLVLSRPNSLFEAFYYVLDSMLDAAGPGRTIHVRTAQRGDDAWIGIGIGPSEAGASALDGDRRIRAAHDLWRELGGQQTIGDGEVRIVLPMHGPASVFSERPGRTVDEKTS